MTAKLCERHKERNEHKGPEVLWVGAGGLEEGPVGRAGLPYRAVSAVGVRGRGPLAAARGLWQTWRGFNEVRGLMAEFRPDVLFVTGGYVSVPAVLAAWSRGVPVLVYLPDVEPGLAVKFTSRLAGRVAVSVPEAAGYFPPGRAVVTGYPVRPRLHGAEKPASRQKLGLGGEKPVLLVLGGSQGARSINRAALAGLERLLEAAQVLHVCGERDYEECREGTGSLPDSLRADYHLFAYLHDEMVDALCAADLVVSRAGASTLGEFPAAGLPALLVPYPYAGAHQWRNADYLAKNGAAVTLDDSRLPEELVPMVLGLLADERRRREMSGAAGSLARPDAADNVARELEVLCL